MEMPDEHCRRLLLTSWQGIAQAGVASVGGKAASLARLAELDFEVPPGLVVPSGVHDLWLAEARTECLHAAQAAQAVGGDQSVDRGAALQALHLRLLSRPPPQALMAELRLALAAPGWAGTACAVRSSAPQEDSARASFAGIHHTALNVTGAEAVARAVVEVWASLWTPSAVAYRQRIGLAHGQATMAVLVMPLVAARASGIAFSCDPISGRDDRLVVHANHGLGDSLVDGQAEGDEAVLEVSRIDEGLNLVRYVTGSKRLHSRPSRDSGTERQTTPPDLSGARVLDDAQVLRLGRLLRLAATALGDVTQPFDMEWAWDGQRFWLLQARPVTAVARCTYAALRHLPDIWSRGNSVDVLPHPLSPVEWATVLGSCNSMLESGWRLAGYPLHPGMQRVKIIDGRMYLNMTAIQWECFDGIGLLPSTTNRLVGGHQPEIPVPAITPAAQRQHFWRKVRYGLHTERLRRRGRRQIADLAGLQRAWRTRPLPNDDADRAALIVALMRAVRGSDGMLFMQGSGGGALSTLVDLLDERQPGQGHGLAAALMAGGPPSVSAQQGYELVRVAHIARADATTRHWLARPAAQRGDWRALPEGNPFRQAFSSFIDRYGHRGIYETYLRNPRWHEQADDLLDSLPGLADTDLQALAERQRAAVAGAWRQLKASTAWTQRIWLRLVLRAAQRDSNDREAARSGFIAGAEPLRRLLLALGTDWAGRGWLDAPIDILQLMVHETLAVLEGTRPGRALRPLVTRRKRLFDQWQQTVPRDVVVDGDEALLQPASITLPDDVAAPDLSGHLQVLHGTAVGSGRASGPVRLVHSPAEGADLQSGEILVAPSTDPAWTPLFLRAAGLVVGTGGFMSHGAIVAREFGLPAVVNLPGVMWLLRDGERVQVDGMNGTVTRLDPPAAQD